jgi:hypothetical protein
MKRAFVVIAAGVALGSSAFAQDVRGLGLGGALVPGPGLGAFNPAYGAYPPDGRGGGLVLPLGLLNFFVNPTLNILDFATNPSRYQNPGDPTSPEFNALAAFDQATHLNTFILNPVPAPREINVNISSTGVTLTDQNGAALAYNFSSGGAVRGGASTVGAAPLFRIPFGVGPLQFGLGVFVNFSGPSLAVSSRLQADVIAGGGKLPADSKYPDAVVGGVQASAGISFDAAFSTSFSLPEAAPGVVVYAGGRGAGFYGLAFVEGTLTGSVNADSSGDLNKASTDYKLTLFRADPTNGGFGFGLNADVGAAVDLPGAILNLPELEKLNVGLGIVGLVDYYTWNGQEQTTTSAGTSSPVTATRAGGGFDPLVTFNMAGTFSLASGLRVLALGDVQFGRGEFAAHLGGEAQLGLFSLRGGIGYQNGFRFGLGGSVDVSQNIGFDLALTTHQAPFYNYTDFGIALAVRFRL